MMTQQGVDAMVNALLNSLAEMALKAANLSGQLADANAVIVKQEARIEELEKTQMKTAP